MGRESSSSRISCNSMRSFEAQLRCILLMQGCAVFSLRTGWKLEQVNCLPEGQILLVSNILRHLENDHFCKLNLLAICNKFISLRNMSSGLLIVLFGGEMYKKTVELITTPDTAGGLRAATYI